MLTMIKRWKLYTQTALVALEMAFQPSVRGMDWCHVVVRCAGQRLKRRLPRVHNSMSHILLAASPLRSHAGATVPAFTCQLSCQSAYSQSEILSLGHCLVARARPPISPQPAAAEGQTLLLGSPRRSRRAQRPVLLYTVHKHPVVNIALGLPQCHQVYHAPHPSATLSCV